MLGSAVMRFFTYDQRQRKMLRNNMDSILNIK